MNQFSTLSDQQLSDAIAEKSAAAETERAAASMLGIPARVANAKRIEEQIGELRAEQAKRERLKS